MWQEKRQEQQERPPSSGESQKSGGKGHGKTATKTSLATKKKKGSSGTKDHKKEIRRFLLGFKNHRFDSSEKVPQRVVNVCRYSREKEGRGKKIETRLNQLQRQEAPRQC